jgi:putative phosphoesterase
MKVALIGDIHANLPALNAVLDHAREQGATGIWNAGDLVGYGAYPQEVIRALQSEGALSTIGSYDQRVLRFKKRKERWRRKKRVEEYMALEWTYSQLSKKDRKYLRFLSQEMRMTVKGRRVLVLHSCPGQSASSVRADEPTEALVALASKAGAELIICGRSHRPSAHQVDGVWFINPGSVGLPVDNDPRASYALLAIKQEEIQVQHHRVDYDVEQMVTALKDRGLPEAFAQVFQEGLELEALLDKESH